MKNGGESKDQGLRAKDKGLTKDKRLTKDQ